MANKKKDAEWAEAKRLCRMSDEEIRMAKELGMTPRSLTKNIPNYGQEWKAPVSDWVRRLHEKKFRKSKGESGVETSDT